MPAAIHLEPAYDDWHGGVGAAGDHEKSPVLSLVIVMDLGQHGETSDGYADGDDGKEEPVFEVVGKGSHEHAEDECGSPGRDGEELCLDLGVAVRLDDRRCKIGVSIGWDDQAKVHETAQEEFVVPEAMQHISCSHFPVERRLSLIFFQSALDEPSLILAQPFGLLWKVWNDKEPCQTDDAGENAFQDEDPTPARMA